MEFPNDFSEISNVSEDQVLMVSSNASASGGSVTPGKVTLSSLRGWLNGEKPMGSLFARKSVPFSQALGKNFYVDAASRLVACGRFCVQLYLIIRASKDATFTGSPAIPTGTYLGSLTDDSAKPMVQIGCAFGDVSQPGGSSLPSVVTIQPDGSMSLTCIGSLKVQKGSVVACVSMAYVNKTATGAGTEQLVFLSPLEAKSDSKRYHDALYGMSTLLYAPYVRSGLQNAAGAGDGSYGGYISVAENQGYIAGNPPMFGSNLFIAYANAPGGLDYFGFPMNLSQMLGGESTFAVGFSLPVKVDGSAVSAPDEDSEQIFESENGVEYYHYAYIARYTAHLYISVQAACKAGTVIGRILRRFPVTPVIMTSEYGATARIDTNGIITCIAVNPSVDESVLGYATYLTADGKV